MADIGTGCGEKGVCVVDALDGIQLRLRPAVEVAGQTLNLIDVEDGIGLQEGDGALDILAAFTGFRAGDAVGVDHRRAVLALAHMRAER